MMFNHCISSHDDREFQLHTLGFPLRLMGRGVAAVRRKLPWQEMECTDTVTIDAAMLDHITATLKRSYNKLKEARMVARS